MKHSFLLGIKTEWLKYKHTSLFWLTLLAASLIPVTKFISCVISDDLYSIMKIRDQWHFFLMINWRDTAAATLPMYVILLNNSIAQTEYRNNTWKQVYALPRSYADIYFSKFMLVPAMIILFFICFHFFYLVAGVMVFLVKGVHGFSRFPLPWKQMLIISQRVYIGTLMISAIQYWLSVRFRKFMIPVGTGFGLWIGSVLIGGWGKSIYSPYLLALLMFFVDHSPRHYSLNLLYIISLGGFLLALLLGFLNMYFRSEKG